MVDDAVGWRFTGCSAVPSWATAAEESKRHGAPSSSPKGGGSKTVSKRFRQQLSDLMETLNSTQPHYVRCIKPNQLKQPGLFSGQIVFEQLTYSGEAAELTSQLRTDFAWKRKPEVERADVLPSTLGDELT